MLCQELDDFPLEALRWDLPYCCSRSSRSLAEVSSSRMWLQSYCWRKKLCHLLGDSPGLKGRLLWIHRAVRLFSFPSTTASQALATFSAGGSQASLSSRIMSGEGGCWVRGRGASWTVLAGCDFLRLFSGLTELSFFLPWKVSPTEGPC